MATAERMRAPLEQPVEKGLKPGALGRADGYTKARAGPAGTVMAVDFGLAGQKFVAAGRKFTFNEAISLQIPCADQAEVDYHWSRLSEGGLEVARSR
jgi:predicted 3-demethylubiquinone-9 3-methyltransferase (glyoxalase superfamily)